MKFDLYKDVKVSFWRRYSYSVEAETLEEAVELVKDDEVDYTDMEDLYNTATREIYSAEDDVLLYSNKDNV
jgi:hypothetical protein